MEQGPEDSKLPDASGSEKAAAATDRAAAEKSEKAEKGASVRTVTVLYNTDYDPIPEGRRRPVLGRDRSEVAAAAFDVKDAISAFGLDADIMGVEGRDLAECVTKLRKNTPDLIFNLTESLAQDSTNEVVIPAVLDMLGIPFTGTGAMGLGLCLHKPKAKDILRSRGVPTPASCTIERAKDAAGVDLPFPLFCKLSREDASVGIKDENVIHDRKGLVKRVRDLLEEFQQPVLVERYVEGREVYVTLLGNERVSALPFHEIDFSRMPAGRPRIVGYAAKWDENSPEYAGTTPVRMKDITPGLRASIERTAIAAFRALELRDYGRVDFRVSDDGIPYVIDVNPNCDISPDAGVARAARAAGMGYPQLIGRICEIAWERYRNAHSKAHAA
jgi:D-alanine-D-alanine ligase